jgi:hypothetical protein
MEFHVKEQKLDCNVRVIGLWWNIMQGRMRGWISATLSAN